MTSVWLDKVAAAPAFGRLQGNLTADVCVIGGGIVGVTTALLLHEAGARIVLLEADRIGSGVTGHTTAKVTSQHGLVYAELARRLGADAACTYGAANEAALAWIAARVAADGINCDFRRRDAYAYARDGATRDAVEVEARAAAAAGLPATVVERTELPYPVAVAERFADQAEFHPIKYLRALAAQLPAERVFERTRAVQAGEVVRTPGGNVVAAQVVVATHYPFTDRSLAFMRVHPERSYAVVCRIAGEPPDGMFISAGSPTRSVRAVPVDGEELLLVGGEGHRTGTGGDTSKRYARLEAFAREHWDVRSVAYRWSAQDNATLDGVPYVGPLTPLEDRVLMATGFAKWGMTGGTAAALIAADRLLGRPNEWAALFDPNRLNARAAAGRFLKENAVAGLRLVADRLSKPGQRPIDDLPPGEGDIVRHDGEKVAGYRGEDGRLVAVSATCSHLGCQVNWNRAERSWDCPCHGSRFAVDGQVLEGPAVHPLERKPI